MYLKIEVKQERIREYISPESKYIGPKDNNIYYGVEKMNYKNHDISHIVVEKNDGLHIISFNEWAYDIQTDSHYLKTFDSIVFNGDRYAFDYHQIRHKILERYPKLKILKTEVFDSKDKLNAKTPDRLTFMQELERYRTPDDIAFDQDSNIKIDNIEFESDDFADMLEKNPMNFDEMHFKTEEEKENEYIENELKKANEFKFGALSIFLNNKFKWICCAIAVISMIQMIIFIDNTKKSFIFFMLFVGSLIALTSKD